VTAPVIDQSTGPGVREPAHLQLVDQTHDLGDVLRAYRESRRLTVGEAGRLVGGSHWVWAQWERGVRPSPVYMRHIATLLGRTVEELRSLAGPDRVRRASSVGESYSHPLAQARARAGLSAAAFARTMHVSPSLVSRWEADQRVPGRHYWPRLAAALGVEIGDIERMYRETRAPSDMAYLTALRVTRVRRRMTQRQLAAAVGVDVTSVQRWEQHGRAPLRQAERIARALSVDLEVLARPTVAPRPAPRVTRPLRRLRRSRNLSTGLVAARTGVARGVLLSWERGCSTPSWGQARALARALAVPVEEVFAAAGMPTPQHLDPAGWRSEALDAILRELRMWQAMTQEQLAARLGVSPTTVRAWEGDRQRPRRAALEAFDRMLGVSPRLVDIVYPRQRV
jgi:transcriptional regulator with XRE-family HTH domain